MIRCNLCMDCESSDLEEVTEHIKNAHPQALGVLSMAEDKDNPHDHFEHGLVVNAEDDQRDPATGSFKETSDEVI